MYICSMQALNFPPYQFKAQKSPNGVQIWCAIRRKWLVLTPEEWVRQHVIQWLIHEKSYPQVRIQVEKLVKVNGTIKRYDIVVYQPDGQLTLLVECKAPQVPITQSVFDQIARYNFVLNSTFLMVTNGLQHYYCQMDYQAQTYRFLTDIPTFE